MASHTSDWLTIPEAADILRVTRATIYRWARQGKIQLSRVGNRAGRVRRPELEHLNQVAPASGTVTVVGPESWQVYELNQDISEVEHVLARFTGHAVVIPGEYGVFLNQAPSLSTDVKLDAGDLIVLIARDGREDAIDKSESSAWLRLAESTFARDWDNERDAIYDNWKELYGLHDR